MIENITSTIGEITSGGALGFIADYWQFALIAIAIAAVIGRKESKNRSQGGGGFTKIKRLAYGDDLITEGNGWMDWVYALALANGARNWFRFMGGTRSKGRPNVDETGDMLNRKAGMGSIQVHEGASTIGMREVSEYSRALINMAKEGPSVWCIGGKWEDAGSALKQAPEIAKNVTIYGIAAGNENDGGNLNAYRQVKKSGARVIEFNRQETFTLIRAMNPGQADEWLNKHLWPTRAGKIAMQKKLLDENRRNNGGQPAAGRQASAFRGADCLTVLAALYGKKRALDPKFAFKKIEEGLARLPR